MTIKAYYYPTLAQLPKLLQQSRRAFNRPAYLDAGYETGSESLIEDVTSRYTQPFEDDEFRWKTHSGAEILPEDMATMHLFYAVRMLFNNTVAPCFRVGKFRRYNDIKEWSSDYRHAAAQALTGELLNRDDLDLTVTDSSNGDSIQDQLQDMYRNAEVMDATGFDNVL